MTFNPDQPLKAFGPAIPWSDADLETLSEVTDADILAAAIFWAAYAPQPYKSLLEAQVQDG